MSNALSTISNGLGIWEDNKKIEEIRKLFAPTLTETEFQFFVGLGKATGLNPFTREIWSVKYDKNAPAQVFIGRDGYRKAAQAHSEYDFHQADAVYENDEFEVVNGEVKHKYSLKDRGSLVGAYCVAKRHKSSRPMYVFVELKEYSTGRSVWKDKPATMAKKVAESQCLRACFQDLLGGTYGEEEMSDRQESKPSKSEALMNKIKSAKGQTIDVTAEPEEINAVECATESQLREIMALMACKEFEEGRLDGALSHYKAEKLSDLTSEQAEDFIGILNKLADKD